MASIPFQRVDCSQGENVTYRIIVRGRGLQFDLAAA